MHFTPSSAVGHNGAPPAEAPGPPGWCAPPPSCPPASFHWSPGLWTPQWETPEGVPPAGESSPFGSRGETSWGDWEALLEDPRPFGGVSPMPFPSAALTTESQEASASEWSESEGATSGVSSGPPAKTDAPQRKKKKRFRFSSEQLQALERIFQNQKYLEISEMRQLAASLGLTDKKIKTWFQNRRMKFKKQRPRQEQHFVPSAPFLSYDPRIPPNFSQDFSMYPQQNAVPCMSDSGLPSSSPCPPYQFPVNPPFPLLAPGLPSHFSPELSTHPAAPYGLDYMPPPPSAE